MTKRLNYKFMSGNAWPDFRGRKRKRGKITSALHAVRRPSGRSRIRSAGNIGRNLLHGILMAIIVAFLGACSSTTAGLSREEQDTREAAARAQAQVALSVLNGHNARLSNFKGIGKLKVWQKGKLKINEQVAWIGSGATKISLVVMVGGQPAVRMASDGKWFYYYEIGRDDTIYKKISASDASLKRIIAISIQTADVLSLLAGKIPIREHRSAILEKQEANPGYVLVLKRRWWGITEKIYVDENKTQARQVEFYNRTGSLTYRARFDEMQTVNGFQVPARLSITNGKDTDVTLDVRKFWADVAVTDSMFVLKPPE